jgi:glutamate 5-kinase
MKKENRQLQEEPVFKRVVVKVGTRLVTGDEQHLNLKDIAGLVDLIARLHQRGVQVIVVSSGAITAGRQKLKLKGWPKGVPYRQVLAAVGQSRLMNTYEYLFDRYDITIAQALLTKTDLAHRAGYLNARNTLLALMEAGAITIVNENDVISTEEIKERKFGDNDNLSALVANLVDADALVILTDIDGLYTADPGSDPAAELIPLVTEINNQVREMAKATRSDVSTGGMVTKLEAAKLATASGVQVIIANGRTERVLERLVAGEGLGTRFVPTCENMESRDRWMVSGLCTRGRINVDEGAAAALRRDKRSLLAAGISGVEGGFARGDVVAIFDSKGKQLGCGITNYSASDISIIKGSRSDRIAGLLTVDHGPEVVHRNNLALLQREGPRGHRQTVSSQQ